MPRPIGDVYYRLPLYYQMIHDTRQAIHEGLTDGVDPVIFERLEGAFPVGILPDGSVAVPQDYDPSTEMPILALAPNETGRIDASPFVRATIGHLIKRRVMAAASKNIETLPLIDISTIGAGLVLSRTIDVQQGDKLSEDADELWMVPSLVIARPQDSQLHNNALILAHEANHWDYMCRVGRIAVEGSLEQTLSRFAVAVERRAYATTYRLEHNMGRYTYLPLPHDFLILARDDDDPAEFAAKIRNTKYINSKVGINQHIPNAIMAAALTLRYADPVTGGVTDDEVAGYGGGGLVHVL